MRSRFCGRRAGLAAATVLVIGIGLTTRLPGIDWGPLVGKYLGSLLWGAMVYCLVGLMRPRWRVSGVALVAACIAVSVELSQLWHAPWLDRFRQTRLGVLLLGRFFAWADIAAYLAGIALATAADRLLSRSNGVSRDAA